MTKNYIQIATPLIGEEEWLALKEPLTTGWLTQGPKVAAFEKAFAARHRVGHALATSSCTTALHLALSAVGVGPGDLVIAPSFTWVATANAVEYLGATPVFCDSRREDYNIDPVRLQQTVEDLAARGQKVKAIIAVHLFGLIADMDAVNEIAAQHSITVIEDAACAAGAAYRGRPAGGLGAVGCFSFHPRKILTTGEGGMCTTDDAELAEKMGCLRNHGASISEERRHGAPQPYLLPDFEVLGYNYRMSDLQGAVGLVQLGRLDEQIRWRREKARWYTERLTALPWFRPPTAPQYAEHSWQAYVGLVDAAKIQMTRNEIMASLHEAGIASRPGTHAIHELGYYSRRYGLASQDFPVASELYHQTLALPLHGGMTGDDFERVARHLEALA